MLEGLPEEKEAYISGHFLLHENISGEKVTYDSKNTGKTHTLAYKYGSFVKFTQLWHLM